MTKPDINELKTRELDILRSIQRSGGTATPAYIAKEVGVDKYYAGRLLAQLFEKGFVTRIPAKGRSYNWSINSHGREAARYSGREKSGKREWATDPAEKITPEKMEMFFKVLAGKRFDPDLFKYSYRFPHIIAELYRMASFGREGGKIKQQDLDKLRNHLGELVTAARIVFERLNGVYLEEDLWDSKELPIFLILDNPEQVDLHIENIYHWNPAPEE